MPHYVRAGVRHLWIVDPIAKMLEVYRSESERWTLIATHSDDDKVRAEPFDAIEIDLAILWRAGAGGGDILRRDRRCQPRSLLQSVVAEIGSEVPALTVWWQTTWVAPAPDKNAHNLVWIVIPEMTGPRSLRECDPASGRRHHQLRLEPPDELAVVVIPSRGALSAV